ncbi:MAG: FKBP-type peptidyl-prolyl cis-trans isomerase [Chloroflexi bacterium]|nr:FKBP-type peptidyl-prolyl cis-trans isomerase [Chloroflexota bacterium]MCI0856773.1 FKBP-type peptidyl-prolyl cis-trans isomerase [Chloroflexota bacterium]
MKVIVAVLLAAAVLAVACGDDGFTTMPTENAQERGLVKNCKPESTAPARTEGETFITKGGVEVVVVTVAPDTNPAQANDTIAVNYTGSLEDGDQFVDSLAQIGQPFTFGIHIGDVICGWVEGVVGMSPGEVRLLTIPPALAYGDGGFGDLIPPDSVVVFEIEMLSFEEPEPTQAAP